MNEERTISRAPSAEKLECLIRWPSGSQGETKERDMLKTYIDLCKENGFGRMSQIADEVEDIWRHPKSVAKYEKEKKNFFKELNWK